MRPVSAPPRPTLGAAVGLLVLLGPLLATAIATAGPAGASALCQAAPRSGEEQVAVVVDFSDQAGSPGGVSSVCVPVSLRSNGAAVLAARAAQLGRPAPRYENGLLCAIDGFPTTGCGDRTSGGYRYWSYWLGDGSWTYASVGPAGHRADASTVEGWRFVSGNGTGADPPPRGSAQASAICHPAPPTTRAPAATTTAPGSLSGVASSPTPQAATTTTPGGATTTTTTAVGATTTTLVQPSAAGGAGGTSTTAPGAPTTGSGEGNHPAQLAAARTRSTKAVSHDTSGNASTIAGTAIVIVLIAGLLVGAAVRSRRRPAA